jgi:LacI family transcriptional regulator
MEKKIVASQNDIARVAKVSRSTVSRALINHPTIPPDTRRRILEIAEELGYKKNPVVSMLTAQIRSSKLRRVESTLAYMTTLSSPLISERNPAYYQFFVGAKKRAEELGYGLDTIWRKEKAMTSDRMTRILSSRGIRGIVLAPRPDALTHITLKWDQFVAVAVGHPLPAPRLSFSGAWHYDLISKALRATSKYGYRRVGFAIAPDADRYSQYAFSARYHLYQNLLPAKLRVPLLYRPMGKEGFDIRKFERWFEKYRPEVILHAGGVIPTWLERLNISVPGDVACVDICLTSDDGRYAGVFERPEVIAAAAVDLVVEQLHSNTLGPPVLPKIAQTAGQWVDGPTLPRRK